MIDAAFRNKAGIFLALIFCSGSWLQAGDTASELASSNPLQGKLTLTRKGCITCHSIWGVGGKMGPDLATSGADQSFQQMASMFWNHTPRMVQSLKQKGTDWPVLSEKEMADVISFIYYLKLLDRPGDPALGKVLFHEKKCEACHALRQQPLPLGQFGAYVSPVNLAQAMWNAGRAMHQAQQAAGIAMPLFQGREMADLQAYIRSESTYSQSGPVYLPLPDISRGGALFRSKGCAVCHGAESRKGVGPDLSKEPLRKSISEICGTLWNHSFAMQARMTARGIAYGRLEKNELADILAYIYFLHFSRDEGDAARGEKIFTEKGCANCHAAGTSKKNVPNLGDENHTYDMLRLATSMWNHAPIMYQSMESEVMKWIKLDPNDMQDLSKFLRRPKNPKAPPDPKRTP